MFVRSPHSEWHIASFGGQVKGETDKPKWCPAPVRPRPRRRRRWSTKLNGFEKWWFYYLVKLFMENCLMQFLVELWCGVHVGRQPAHGSYWSFEWNHWIRHSTETFAFCDSISSEISSIETFAIFPFLQIGQFKNQNSTRFACTFVSAGCRVHHISLSLLILCGWWDRMNQHVVAEWRKLWYRIGALFGMRRSCLGPRMNWR